MDRLSPLGDRHVLARPAGPSLTHKLKVHALDHPGVAEAPGREAPPADKAEDARAVNPQQSHRLAVVGDHSPRRVDLGGHLRLVGRHVRLQSRLLGLLRRPERPLGRRYPKGLLGRPQRIRDHPLRRPPFQ